MEQGQQTWESGLGHPGPLQERLARAKGWLDENLRNDPAAARRLIGELLPQAEAAGEQEGATWLRFFLGWLHLDADDYERGFALMEANRKAFEALGDGEGVARCLNALGVVHSHRGSLDLALDYLRESTAQAERVGRPDIAGAAAMNTAECLYNLDEPQEALLVIEHCLRNYAIAPHNVTTAHSQAGSIYRCLGRFQEAERELLQAIETAGKARHDRLEACHILAETYLDAGRLDEAEGRIVSGLADCTAAGERLFLTRFHLARARLSVLRGAAAVARVDIDIAIELAKELGARKIELDAERLSYVAWQACGEWEKALAAFVRHSQLKEAMRGEQTTRRILGMHDERARREALHFEALYQQISSISEIRRRITSNLNLESALDVLYDAVNGLMDAPTLMIALVDEERQCLDYRLVVVRGERHEPFAYPLTEPTFGCWCVNHRSDVHIGDLESEFDRYVPSYDDLLFEGVAEKSLVFVPLFLGEKVVGVLSVQSHLPHAYDKRKVEIIRAVGAYIAIAIENSRLFQQLQRLATLDSLTGLLNRRRLSEVIEDAYLMHLRYRNGAGVIMLDIDHFKQVNDTYGHDMGDHVLRRVSTVLTENVRNCDSIGRFGGEEFVILLPETGLEGTQILAERLREAIHEEAIQLVGLDPIRITASFGVSVFQPGDPSHEAALRRADHGLYHAKQTGRNRVCMET